MTSDMSSWQYRARWRVGPIEAYRNVVASVGSNILMVNNRLVHKTNPFYIGKCDWAYMYVIPMVDRHVTDERTIMPNVYIDTHTLSLITITT